MTEHIADKPLGRASRKVGKNTKTWKIFESLFLDPDKTYPFRISGIPRGEAINLAIGLNCCNLQWAEEQGLPREFIQYSAKAIKGSGDGDWALEISTNFRQQGGRPGAAGGNWMDKYLNAEGANAADTSAPRADAPEQEGENTFAAPHRPSPPSMEDMIGSWVAGGELGRGAKGAPGGEK